jgi:hypothetical protein
MKKFLLLALIATKLSISFAQVPQAFNYQGVARNNSYVVLANKTVKLRLTIHSGSGAGPVLYSETRSVTTSSNGLFNVMVGSAGALSSTGVFSAIDWSAASRWLQTEIDPANGTTFTDLGAVQMQSVPFALSANSADKIKLPMAATSTNGLPLLDITNTTGTAIRGAGQGSGTGFNASTDQGFGVLSIANGSGTAVYGQSATGVAGKFVSPVGNANAALDAEHKANGIAVKGTSNGGTAIQGNGLGQGIGLSGVTDNNIGVLALSNNSGTAIYGMSQKGNTAKFETPATNTNTTLQGIHKGAGVGIIGSSQSGTGVAGYSVSKTGVLGQSSSEIGVRGNSTSGTGVQGYSQTGTAGYFSAPFGAKALEVNGSMKISGQTNAPGLGKVLTSDENGFATWQGPIAFKGTGLGGETFTDPIGNVSKLFYILSTEQLSLQNEEYDYGSAFDKKIFTAPVTGIYHFNAGLLFQEQSFNTPLEEGYVRIVRKKLDGSKVHLASIAMTEFTELHAGTIAVDGLILQGEQVFVEYYVSVVDAFTQRFLYNKAGQTNNWFSGHLVSRVQ